MENLSHLKLAMLAGEILVQSGAETYRVEETMNFILQNADAEQQNAFAFTTGIFATLTQPGFEAQTLIKRIHERAINLHNIARVNEVSRQFCAGDLSMSEAYASLSSLQRDLYPRWLTDFGMILLVGGFVLLLGGSLTESFVASLNAVILALFFRFAAKLGFNPFIRTVLGAMIISMGAVVLQKIIFVANTDIITVSSMMPLVPGTAITNAIRDTLSGDYMSGSSRALEALVIAASVAIGVGLGLTLIGVIL